MVPHAPLLLPEVAGPANAGRTRAVVAAVASIDLTGVDAVVVASPHGRAPGVYAAPAGDLDAFGPRGLGVSPIADDGFAHEIAAAWGEPILDEPPDHGVVVPLRLLAVDALVVAVSLGDGPAFARALGECAGGRRIAFVASANLSAGLGERAPLPSLDGAAETDAAVLDTLRDDPGALTEQGSALERAGSCAAGPLAAFGSLFGGRPCDVLAYEAPFGVGYAVAVTW